MEKTPVLSVIVRTAGRNQRLAECLDSLTQQTRVDFQVVIVDMSDGSAAEVVQRFSSLDILHLETGGKLLPRPVALNHGIRLASGKFIAILDDDNLWLPRQVRNLVHLFQNNGADLVYTGVRRRTYTPDGEVVNESGRFKKFDYEMLARGNFIYMSSIAFRKKTWKATGGFDARFQVYEDWEFFLRVTRPGKVAFEKSFEAVSRNFTGDPTSSSHNLEIRDCELCFNAVLWKHRDVIGKNLGENAPPPLQAALKKSRVIRFCLLTQWWLKHGFSGLKFYLWNH